MVKVVVGFEPGIVKSTSFSGELATQDHSHVMCNIFVRTLISN